MSETIFQKFIDGYKAGCEASELDPKKFAITIAVFAAFFVGIEIMVSNSDKQAQEKAEDSAKQAQEMLKEWQAGKHDKAFCNAGGSTLVISYKDIPNRDSLSKAFLNGACKFEM